MKKNLLKHLAAILPVAAFIAFLAGASDQAQAQNNWTLTGSSSSTSGFIILGNSTMNLGDISGVSSPVHFSLNGGDTITLAAGSFLTSTSDYPIDLETNNNHFTNNGTITGGTYEGIYVGGTGNVVVNNGSISAGGSIDDNYAVDMEGNNQTLINNGTISAQYDAVYLSGTHVTFNNNNNVDGGTYGLYLATEFSVINNHGSIMSDEYGIYIDDAFNTINNHGSITGSSEAGIYVDDEHNTINNWGKVTSNSYGIEIEDDYNTLNNHGTISGGDQGVYLGDSYNTINNWGTFTGTEAGMESNEPYNTTNNYGTISGQTYGFYLNDSHNVLNNWGRITNSGTGNAAVWFNSTGYHNDIFNNYGMVSGGPVAIEIESSYDTLNLNGHSSVLGKITLTGSNTDVVNLNFTGLSPATIASLNAQLKPQGVGSGTATSATFTVRGVTYDIDPAIINFNGSSYQLQARTGNQAAVGAALDSLTFNPAPGTPLFTLLNTIDSSGNVPGALDAISPADYASLGDIAISHSDYLTNSIDERLNNIRNGSESIDASGVGGATVAGLTKDESHDGKSGKEVIHASAAPDRWGFFASGDGLFYRGDHRNTGADDKANTAGTLIGVDAKVDDKGVIGALFSYDNTSAQLGSAGSHANIESYSGGVYGSYHDGGLYLNGLAAYTRNDYNTTRNIAIGGLGAAANGSTNGDQETVSIDGGYDWNLNDRFSAGPILDGQYVHLNIDGFSETGLPGVGLNVGSQDINSLQSRLGAHANYHVATSKVSTVALDFHAAWQHEYLNDSRGIGASFETFGTAPFAVQSGSPKRDAAVVGIGANASFHDRMTLFLDYDLQLWSSSTFDQSINGGVRLSF
ncbi:MAG TPA: autotransporter domain-containing protein [Chthoniobacteraceae bacterium]|nr:autotransporter domain-containing protein [Chthoniobacteraceae bacterium]